MKKTIGSYHCEYFRMPRLSREHLEEIEQIILAEIKPEDYRLAMEGEEYVSISEISADHGPVSMFVFETRKPSLRLKLARSWAELYCGEAGPHIDDGIRKIAKILGRAERPFLWNFARYSRWMAPLVGFGSIAVMMELVAMGLGDAWMLYGGLALLAVVAVWWAFGFRFCSFTFSRIEFSTRQPAEGPVE